MGSRTAETSGGFERIRLIHIAFMGAVAVYVLLALQMSVVIDDRDPRLTGMALWALRAALAAIAIAGQATVARVLARPHKSRRPHHLPDEGESALVAAANARAILRLAFTEAIGIYGLLLFLVGGRLFDVVGFCAVALVLLVLRFPTRDAWTRELEHLKRDAAHP